MGAFLLGLLIIIILCGNIFIYGVIIYNKYQQYIIRINEVESLIDKSIRDKFDLLNKSIGVIKANCNIKEELFPEIVKLRSRKLSNFEMDRKLIEPMNQFHKINVEYEDLRKSEAYLEICSSLNDVEEDLNTYKEYYDTNISSYNSLIKKFPTNIVAMIFKYEEKNFFDGVNRNDDIKDDILL